MCESSRSSSATRRCRQPRSTRSSRWTIYVRFTPPRIRAPSADPPGNAGPSQRAAGLPLRPGKVPVAEAIVELHGLAGRRINNLNDVATPGPVEQPLRVGQAHPDAAVADPRASLCCGRPLGAVNELAAPGDPDRPMDAEAVVIRVIRGDTDGSRVHDLEFVLLQYHLDAVARLEALLPCRDGYGPGQCTADVDLHSQ